MPKVTKCGRTRVQIQGDWLLSPLALREGTLHLRLEVRRRGGFGGGVEKGRVSSKRGDVS